MLKNTRRRIIMTTPKTYVWVVVAATTLGAAITIYSTNQHGGIQTVVTSPTISPIAATIAPATIAPVPTPTIISTIVPTTIPTIGTIIQTFPPFTNGQQIPASFPNTNFGASGPLYQPLPASPPLAPYSSTAISYYFANNSNEFQVGWIDGNATQAIYDYRFPIYIASLNDPLVTLSCPGADNGSQIHIPALAKQAGGEDAHLAILEPNGVEYDFWLVTSNPPYSNGSTLDAQGEGHYYMSGNNSGASFIAPGFALYSSTAGGIALTSAQIYISELRSGVINHAISVLFPCESKGWVYPASQTTGTCSNGAGMPLGSRLWWAPTDTQTQAMSLPRDLKTVLVAMHHYGAYFTDNGNGISNINGQGGGMGMHLNSQQQYWSYGGSNPDVAYVQSNPDWNHILNSSVDRYLLAVPESSINFLANLKVIDPSFTHP
jgi:hypothetical protein